MRSSLHKFPVQRNRLIKIMHSGADFRHPIQQHTAHRRTIISHIQNLHAFPISFCFLIDLTDHVQHIHIFHTTPVNRICNLCRCSIVLFLNQFLYLLCFQAIFVLIQ